MYMNVCVQRVQPHQQRPQEQEMILSSATHCHNQIINMLGLRSLFRFAKKKEILVKNFFTQAQLGAYTSLNDSELEAFLEQSKAHRRKWLESDVQKRRRDIIAFSQQIKQNSERIELLLSQCTGKELQECQSEVRVAIKIFTSHLAQQPTTSYRVDTPSSNKNKDYYGFEPFDHLLTVFDHRSPILSAFKYLGLSLLSGTYTLLRPAHTVLPALKVVEQAWSSLCPTPMFTVLTDPELDPKHKHSPIPKLLASTDGFVSFDGRMKDGFDFHYFMTQNSLSLRDSEFLLTSSDSAYVMANLSADKLEKAVKVIARGSFSNCGHNFNSIKRVFVDREVGEAFMAQLANEAKLYVAGSSFEEGNTGLLAPFVRKHELEEAKEQLKVLREKHSDEFRHVGGGDHVEVQVGGKTLDFLTPAIFEVTTDFPNHNYQNEEFMLPICFVSLVDSPSDSIERINSSIFGTAASIFSADTTLAGVEKIGKRLDVGTVNVNTWEVTDGITYSGRKRSGKGFSFSPLSYHNILRTKAVSFAA